jgi:recombinational DNA repair protein (RecF pathway)
MSYSIQTTEGFVLSYTPLREADRVYSVLTRDLGLIRATATGVRKAASKLRGALEPVSLTTVSLVRGKEYWRATSAEVIEKIESSPEILRPLMLLERLVQGEAPHPELFDMLREKLGSKDVRGEVFETRLVAEILFHLGYLDKSDLDLEKKELIAAINNGLSASHLAH